MPVTADDTVIKKAELRVLDIGNSYSLGATRLLPLIAEASKTDLRGCLPMYKQVKEKRVMGNYLEKY